MSLCRVLLILLAAFTAGCQLWIDTPIIGDEQTLLRSVKPPSEAIPLDVYWARFPWGDADMNDALWMAVQEERVPVDVRQRLAANGLRAGVLGGAPPQALANLLAGDASPDDVADSAATPIIEAPRVERRLMHMQPGQVKQQEATPLLDETTLLVNRAGELSGNTYTQAQGVYLLSAARMPDGQVRVELTPEVVHGDPRLKWHNPQPGVMLQSVERHREVFDDLSLYTKLAPGEMLVVMGTVDARGQLGGLFHTTGDAAEREQRILLVRLGQELPTNLSPTSPLDADDGRSGE